MTRKIPLKMFDPNGKVALPDKGGNFAVGFVFLNPLTFPRQAGKWAEPGWGVTQAPNSSMDTQGRCLTPLISGKQCPGHVYPPFCVYSYLG
jgi:hypothetical protein